MIAGLNSKNNDALGQFTMGHINEEEFQQKLQQIALQYIQNLKT